MTTMAAKRRVADDGRQLLSKIRRDLSKGVVQKLFEDEHFISELVDMLYDDGVDVTVKTEVLSVFEQQGAEYLSDDCAEQVVSKLLDVLREHLGQSESQRLAVQLMLTMTTVIIMNDMKVMESCGAVVTQLWEMVCRVNDVPSRRLRGCACQCLTQLEIWTPGLLTRYKDRLVQTVREERTHVFQDYATLLSTVLTNLPQSSAKGDVVSADEIVPPLSFLMDNAFLFTSSGLWSIVISVVELVKATDRVAPSILKPLMLQNMASMDPCMLHMVLYVQKEFQGEILTHDEEHLLLQRMTSEVNLLNLHPALRLLVLQWVKAYLQRGAGEILLDDSMMQGLQKMLRPCVFDSLDIHVDKLNVITYSYPADQDQNLLNDIHYLKRLALTTGNEQAAVGLYRILFTAYTHHQTQHVSDVVIKITQDLVVVYPHLIPLILDSILAIKETLSDSTVYLATLSSLHNQVLNARPAEVLGQFRFYLQVLSVSAKQPDIQQQKTLQFLLRLVQYAEDSGLCEWELGCAVLTICRNMLLHHPSDDLYYDLGELLLEMQSCFSSCEIRNRARLMYALLAGASDEKLRDVLGSKLLGGVVLSQNITNMISGSAKDQGKAEIVYVDSAGLVWQRSSLTPLFTSLESPSDLIHVPAVKGRLESYFGHLAYLKTELVCQHTLTLSEASEHAVLTAVSICLSSSTDSFLHVPDVHLLSVSKLVNEEVTVRFVPTAPQPSVFDVEAMFSTEDSSTVSTSLDPIDITFNDLTLVLPWEQLGVSVLQDKHVVFDELWTLLTGSADECKNRGVESLRVLKCTADKILQTFKDFHLSHSTDDKSGIDKFLMFLPPSYHLLLQVYPQGTDQVVSIATDYWKILPHVNNYLNTLDSST